MNKQIVEHAIHTVEDYLAVKKNGLLGVGGLELMWRERQVLLRCFKNFYSFLVSLQGSILIQIGLMFYWPV